MNNLNKRQKRALRLFTDKKNIFITGSAGTGKSYLISKIIDNYREKNNKKSIVVTSTTGISSLNINGITIHSWSGLRPNTDLDNINQFIELIKNNNKLWNNWIFTKVLIIDEISMLSSEIIDFLNNVAQKIRNNPGPFGGIQLVLTGDFYQLPPVSIDKRDIMVFQAKCWTKIIDFTVELKDIVRQKEDSLVKFLNYVRVGEVNDFVKQEIEKFSKNTNYNGNFTHLYPNRIDVNTHNISKLNDLEGKLNRHLATIVKKKKSNMTLSIPKDSIIVEELFLKKNAFVMFNKNIDFDKGIVNGRQGIFRNYYTSSQGNKYLIIETDDGMFHNVPRSRWEFNSFYVDQYPICLAWALTIHKSQGMSISKLSVDIGSNIFNKGQIYVALSRAVESDYLHISNYSYESIQCLDSVKKFYQDLKIEKNKWYLLPNNSYQNKISGMIKYQTPNNATIIKKKKKTNKNIIETSLEKCIECKINPYSQDISGHLLCENCLGNNLDYRFLTKQEFYLENESLTKSKIDSILKSVPFKTQVVLNCRFKYKLYLVKQFKLKLNESSRKLVISDSNILEFSKFDYQNSGKEPSKKLKKNITLTKNINVTGTENLTVTGTETETGTGTGTVTGTETETGTGTGTVTGTETETGTETVTGTGTETETEAGTETETENLNGTGTGTITETGTGTEAGTETETENLNGTGTGTITGIETETEDGTETETEAGTETENLNGTGTGTITETGTGTKKKILCEVISIRKQNLNRLGYPKFIKWNEEEDNIYIGRNMSYYVEGTEQSKWNNPFSVKKYGIDKSLELYKYMVVIGVNPINNKKRAEGPLMNEIEELRGKTLGCWCKPDKCHGDILRNLLVNKEVPNLPKPYVGEFNNSRSLSTLDKKNLIYKKYFTENESINSIGQELGLSKSTIEKYIVNLISERRDGYEKKLIELGISPELIDNVKNIIVQLTTDKEPKLKDIKDSLPKGINYFKIQIAKTQINK